jgi:hypothetical protein
LSLTPPSKPNQPNQIKQNTIFSNQANQTLNKVSAAIPQETKDFMQSAKEKILDSDKLRSFSLFFGIGEGSGFSPTINPTILCPRLKKNILFFYLNYILLAAVVVVITLFATMINPKTIIMLAILLVALMFVIQSTAGGGLEIRGGAMAISRKSVTALMMAISAVVLFFMVKSLCLWIWVPRRRL